MPWRPLLLVLLVGGLQAHAQEELEGTLEDLLGIKSSIAAKRELTPRESPGIVSVITRDDIEKSGSRDLAEILSLLAPGYAFALDVEGVVGVGVRGLWGHEGKVLLMLDGVPVNEEVFSTTQFGNHYPAEMIDRVEVIRGPGSVIYGGYAMIGVINVISRGVGARGAHFAYRHSQMQSSVSHANATAAIGGEAAGLNYDLTVSGGEGQRSESDMVDGAGTVASLEGRHALNPLVTSSGLNWKGLSVRGVYDLYRMSHLHFGSTMPASLDPYSESFESRNLSLAYESRLSDSWTIKPRYLYRATYPWRINPEDVPDGQFTKYSVRNAYGVEGTYRPSSTLSVLTGLEYSDLRIRIDKDETSAKEKPFNYSPRGLTEEFWVAYTEVGAETGFGNFTVGGRFEQPRNFDPAFVPRLALTRAWERFHYKAMASQSYRAPAGIHPDRRVKQDEPLKPEVATNLELEAGYKFSERFFATANLFDIKVQDPVVYYTGPTSGVYDNRGRLGSTGAETELRYKQSRFEASGNVSYYQRTHAGRDITVVPEHTTSYLGFANWRANLLLGYRLSRHFGVYPSVQYFGERFGYDATAGETGFTLKRAPETTLLNFNLRYNDLFIDGLSLTAGITNLTNQDFKFYQAYNEAAASSYPAIPSLTRGYNFMLAYQLPF